jgi:hypothetical protein
MTEFKVKYTYTTSDYDYEIVEADNSDAAEEIFFENGPWRENIEVYDVEEI